MHTLISYSPLPRIPVFFLCSFPSSDGGDGDSEENPKGQEEEPVIRISVNQ